jgi:hypothetical protein
MATGGRQNGTSHQRNDCTHSDTTTTKESHTSSPATQLSLPRLSAPVSAMSVLSRLATFKGAAFRDRCISGWEAFP